METQNESHAAISELLESRYFKGIYEGDTTLLSTVYHLGTLLFGDVKGQPYARTLEQYLNGVQNRQSPKESGKPFKGEILNIRVVNSIAVAEVRVTMYDFVYQEYLSFHRMDGKWLLVNKMISDVADQAAVTKTSLLATIHILPGFEKEVNKALQTMEAATIKETGCEQFAVNIKKDSPQTAIIYEIYENDEAFQWHLASPHAGEIIAVDEKIKAATNKPYNINLWVSDSDAGDGTVEAAHFIHVRQMFKPYFDELGIGLPEKPEPFKSRFENQERCRRLGMVTVGAATPVDEAIAVESAGVDMVIASGFEAGGHRPSFIASAESSVAGTFVLLQLIREKVKIPVVAAGGIANGKGVAAVLTLGADAVQMGTAFLATEESNASATHKELLFSGAASHTTLTRAYTGRLGRGISNRITRELDPYENRFLPFPLQAQFMAPLNKAAR